MADVRHRTTAGNRFRYVAHLLGLFGLLAATCGFFYVFTLTNLPFDALQEFSDNLRAGKVASWGLLAGASATFYAGCILVVVWLLLELVMAMANASRHRASASSNVYLSIFFALGVLVVGNAIAFRNYWRFDCTRNGEFTLDPELVKELKSLRNDSPTDVVVLKQHKNAIAGSDRRDNVDRAAEQKVVEKVNDLVDQLRELGPRFRVTVLDTEDDHYIKHINELPDELRDAVEAAPEDSILFHANGRVRRMSFTDFLRVDKKESKDLATFTRRDGRVVDYLAPVNLVLIPQGKEKFIRRVLGVEERKPRIGLVTIHPELSTKESGDELSAAGLRKSLEANGFEVVDIITKKWGRGGPTPTAFTYDEYDLDRTEARFNQMTQTIALLTQQMETFVEFGKAAQTEPLPELNKKFGRQIRRNITTEEDRKFLLEVLSNNVSLRKQAIDELSPELAETEAKLKELQKNERAGEGRRMTDVQAKLKAAINDCDLLIIPRLTSMDLAKGYVIRPTFYSMPKDQAEAIRDFVKSGKPVLACFGPMKLGAANEAEPDDLEKMFTRLGVEFGSQTIITDKEARAASERQGEGLGAASELPPLVLDFDPKGSKPENPVHAAFRVASLAVGGKLEIHKSGPRIVDVSPAMAAKLPFAAVILQSVKESWNTDKPVVEEDYVPKFEPAKLDDPRKGTPEEPRRGPFPIGVAIETKVPAEWFDESLAAAQTASTIGAAAGGLGMATTSILMDPENFAAPGQLPKRPTVRIVAFGHGGLFVGKDLNPAQEQLLVHTLNWQLRRGDLLPTDVAPKWRFPRLNLSPEQQSLWLAGTRFALPAFCLFFGTVVFMTRKLR